MWEKITFSLTLKVLFFSWFLNKLKHSHDPLRLLRTWHCVPSAQRLASLDRIQGDKCQGRGPNQLGENFRQSMAWAKSWKTRRCCQGEKQRQGRSRVKESLTRQKKKWKEQGQEPGVPCCESLSLSPRFGECLEPVHWAFRRQPWEYKGGGSEERKGGHSWSHPHWPQKGNSCRADGEEAKDLSRVPARHGAVFLHTGLLEGDVKCCLFHSFYLGISQHTLGVK